MAIENGKMVLPKPKPNILSKKIAAINSALPLIPSRGMTRKYATFTRRYMIQAVNSAVGATDSSVRTGSFTSSTTLLTFERPA